MRRYACPNCSNEVHFRNSECVNCGSRLGYVPARDQMFHTRPGEDQWHDGAAAYNGCANRQSIGCNWLVGAGDVIAFSGVNMPELSA